MIFVRNLLRAPIRSLLTTLGVAAGIGLFVAVTAITRDIRRQIDGVTGAYGLEVVTYERRSTSPFSSRISTAQMDSLLARYGGAVTPLVLGTHNERWSAYALVIGAPAEFQGRVALIAGERFKPGSGEALIGEIAAQRLGLQSGSALVLDGRRFRLAGVYRTGSRLLDGGVMMDLPEAQAILTREGAVQQFTLALFRTEGPADAAALIVELNQRYPRLRAIPGTEFAGAMRLMRVVDAFVRTISVVALLGTCLVVGNALVMSLAERTRELGILMTVGWTPWLVLRMLLAESVVVCAVGALLGNGLALVVLRVLNGIESIGFGWIPVRFPTELAAASVTIALGLALVALVWPAFVVHRIQPLTALRHE
ncbi:MAG: FtsX-like permease family protein [Gemmatimonadota bacterium]|nr:FtsX-like permease family protein [Gemmatimonadota bacterium]